MGMNPLGKLPCNFFSLALLQKNRLILLGHSYSSFLELGIRQLDKKFNSPSYYLGCFASHLLKLEA